MKSILLILLACLLLGCRSQSITHGIPNLSQVKPGIWRGGQPNAEGWAWLKTQGVIRVVKLNTDAEASDAKAVELGLEVLRFPIRLEDQTIGKPSKELLLWAVRSISTSGTVVHCEKGQDRTGLVIGCYRVWVDHWSKEQAYREMLTNGFHPLLRGLMWSWEEDVP